MLANIELMQTVIWQNVLTGFFYYEQQHAKETRFRKISSSKIVPEKNNSHKN